MRGWGGKGDGGVYAILPPGRLIPTETRLFVDEIAKSIQAGWAGKKRNYTLTRHRRRFSCPLWVICGHQLRLHAMSADLPAAEVSGAFAKVGFGPVTDVGT